jgi:hypothetical protein
VSQVRTVVDTVVLRYFLLVDRTELLLRLLGSPLGIARVVYDPDEGDVPPDAMSEMTRAIYDQRRKSDDRVQPEDVRASANKRMQRLHAIHSLHGIGHIEVMDMTDDERTTFARLMSRRGAASADLMFGLAAGEAATIALSIGRSITCATDDNDALHALEVLAHGHPYERIRKMLARAAAEGFLAPAEANAIHAEMRRAGFWDDTEPCVEP